MRDVDWFERQLRHCNGVLELIDREHTEQEREAAQKQLDEYRRKDRRSAPQQNELNLAA